MAVMQGLASFEIFKTGAILFLVFICFCISIFFTISNINKNYTSTTVCNIKTNSDLSQTITYTVNNKAYTKNVPPSEQTVNNVKSLKPTYTEGSCTLYYSSKNPDDYSINFNPTIISEIFAGILLLVLIGTFIWFSFLRSNRDFAGVVGGIDVANTVTRNFRYNY